MQQVEGGEWPPSLPITEAVLRKQQNRQRDGFALYLQLAYRLPRDLWSLVMPESSSRWMLPSLSE
jgi:hypothetical protein